MSYVSHVVGQSRLFDHLYDPLFQASDYKDVTKANHVALNQSAPYHILSNFSSMFSDMPRRPSFSYWKPQNPLPHFPYKSDSTFKQRKSENIVDGRDACRFFHVAPDAGPEVPEELHLDIPEDVLEKPPKMYNNVGCQTIYRESSAQTRPYLPDGIAKDCPLEDLEIVHVSNILTTETQPGNFETQIIERARRRRKWEKSLPEMKSMKDFEKRRVVLEALEWEHWLARELEIAECQDLRYDLVQRLLEKREEHIRYSSTAKIENTMRRIEAKRQKQLSNLRHKYARSLRKLEMKHKGVPRKYKSVDTFTEHTDLASDLYAPQMRFGVHPKRRHFVPYKTRFEPNYEDLQKYLERPMMAEEKPSNLRVLVKPKESPKEIVRGFSRDKNLKELYKSLQTLRYTVPISQREIFCLEAKSTAREEDVQTPIGIEEDVGAEEEYQACIFLQKIIKGRAVQNMIYAGRNKYRALIEEVQSTHQLSAVRAMYPGKSNEINQKRAIVLAQRKRLQHVLESKSEVDKMLREAEAPKIGFLLDYLQKELQRLYEQRREHAWAMLVEYERKKREAAEARRKELEDHIRRKHDEMYRNNLKTTYDTVSMYLENILCEEVERKAMREAKKHVQEMVKRIDLEASTSTQRDGVSQSLEEESDDTENTITNLLKEFVFPEVQKRLARQRSDVNRQHHLLAAHRALYTHVDEIFKEGSPRTESSMIANMILSNLIDKVITNEGLTEISEMSVRENSGEHETFQAIKSIIQKAFPVSQDEHGKFPRQSDLRRKLASRNSDILDDILSNISDRLWEYAMDEAESVPPNENIRSSRKESSDLTPDTLEDGIDKLVIDRDESEDASAGSGSETADQTKSEEENDTK